MKIASWNVNSLRVRLPQVLDWLAAEQPDVLALQETKLQDPDFPEQAIRAVGYHVCFCGQKTYNGVALLGRTPPQAVVTELDGVQDPQRRLIAATFGGVRVLNVYVPNGQHVGSDKYQYKLQWLAHLASAIEHVLEDVPKLAVVGDFNIAPEDRDVHDPQAWAGAILCSEPERASFRALLQTGLSDSFRLFDQPDRAFSWWDYRAMAFRRNMGLRIDHILISPPLRDQCRRSWIDRAPRQLERPSDHAPVAIEFDP